MLLSSAIWPFTEVSSVDSIPSNIEICFSYIFCCIVTRDWASSLLYPHLYTVATGTSAFTLAPSSTR